MILEVVKYGTPVLRKKGDAINSITPAIRQLVADMFETMYAHKGVGLAAQQVGQSLQVTVLDVRGVTDRPSTIAFNGREADVAALMPLVLINPEIQSVGVEVKGPEGCLSFPEIFGEITRRESVDVRALDADGKEITFRAGGLLARAIQHEFDHLQGILFIDRMDKKTRDELRPELEDLQIETKERLKRK
jgi:peptide deformylase